jgi:anti-anti-sigma factor
MKYSIDKHDILVVFELNEDKLQSNNAPQLKTELTVIHNEGYKNIVLDLNNVKFVDSSGLSAILMANRLCKDSNGTFALCNLNDQVKSLIKISQLENILNIFHTLSEATDFVKMEELEREINA